VASETGLAYLIYCNRIAWNRESVEGESPVYYNEDKREQVKWKKICLNIGEPSSKAKYRYLAIVKSSVSER